WCFCLYGWRTPPLLMGFIIYTTGLVPLAPTGVLVTIEGLLYSHLGYFCCHRGNTTKLSHHLFYSLYDIFLLLCLTTSTGSPLTSESGAIDVISYFLNNFHNIYLDCLRHNLSTKVPIELWSSIFLCFPFGLPMDGCLCADS
ncbi:hypothetical protein FGF83_23510, partial [Salmonella sp. zj-h16]|nr:hypothetical protein [Salmonella sp. zj-h16]